MSLNSTNNNHNAPAILIVEDTAVQAMRFKLALENYGCHVRWEAAGEKGLSAAREENFDLIVLDIELPDITGFEVCRQLKADPTLAGIPVIMLTSRDQAADVLTGLEEGAIDYIPKDPFAEIVLWETIKQMGLAHSG